MNTPLPTQPASPFALDDAAAYAVWRAAKLSAPPHSEILTIDDPGSLSDAERKTLLRRAEACNFALFRVASPPHDIERALVAFGRRLGLLELDQNLCAEASGVTAITVKKTETDHTYIPYTDRPLGWHTDGYYNAGSQQIRAWLLYCVRPAAEGGANELLDLEIAYIRLRDENPEWIRALMAPDAFTIPGNIESGKRIRPDHSGPVFAVSADDGRLHMRYSARQRNVVWKDDTSTREAAAFLLDLFERGDDYIFRHRLGPDEGVISNNVLHRRDGFRDGREPHARRLLYRARYYRHLPDSRENLTPCFT